MEEETKQPRKRAPWRDEIDVLIKDYGDRTGTAIQYNSKENAIEKVPEVVAENITKLEEMYFWLKFKLAE